MRQRPYLSVVIPAYNEEENFNKGVLDLISNYIKSQDKKIEVIIVDDGSDDNTAKLIDKYISDKQSWKLIRNPHAGKAQAVAKGIFAAKGEYLLFSDFDQATPISEVEKLISFTKKNYQIVIGSREIKGSKREEEPWYRHFMGKVFNAFVQLLTIRGIHDTQCGFKLFKTQVAQKLFKKLRVNKERKEKTAYTGAFDVEILFIAQKLGIPIAEVPVHWRHVETKRINPLRDSIKMLMELVKIRLFYLLGKYEI